MMVLPRALRLLPGLHAAPMLAAIARSVVRHRCASVVHESSVRHFYTGARNMAAEAVTVVPVLEDNYSYIIADPITKSAAVVDPVEPSKVKARADELGLKITAILTTHSHWDHAGGNLELKSLVPDVAVYGGKGDNIPGVTQEVREGDTIQLGGTQIRVLFTPCHTAGHVCYLVQAPSKQALFTGDTLFVAGCGNFNNGTPQQMYDALYNKIAVLPADTQVYVGHEYTYKNLLFAAKVEPDNKDVAKKLAWADECRKNNSPTVPSNLAEELATNPFLRVHEAAVQQFTKKQDPVEILAEVRRLKNEFGRGGSV